MLSVRQVSKRLALRPVLRDASFEAGGGEVIALTGANGAGKSTLLRIVAGVLLADAGDVIVVGDSMQQDRTKALAHVGYAPEHADVPEFLRGREWLSLVASLKRAEWSDREDDAGPLGTSQFVHQRVGSLSLGQRRRLTLRAARLGNPKLLLLDEPTNGLDAAALTGIAELFTSHAAGGGTVLFATHDAGFARDVGARLLRVADGGVTAG